MNLTPTSLVLHKNLVAPSSGVLDSGILSEEEAKALTERYRSLNGIQLS